MNSFLDATPRAADYPLAWARSARVALAALVGPPVLLGLSSAAGYPLRSGVDVIIWSGALLGFAGAGWLAGRQTRQGLWGTVVVAAGSFVTGVFVTPAFRGLQGLTGHEPVVTVVAATLGAFAAGFGLGGAIAAFGVGVAPSRLTRTGLAGAVAGVAGGVLALLPYAWSLVGVHFPGDTYLWMALTVIAFLGCVIVPFHWAGAIIGREAGGRGAIEQG
jgi:hypothetical protein